jgi:hypothetical protein
VTVESSDATRADARISARWNMIWRAYMVWNIPTMQKISQVTSGPIALEYSRPLDSLSTLYCARSGPYCRHLAGCPRVALPDKCVVVYEMRFTINKKMRWVWRDTGSPSVSCSAPSVEEISVHLMTIHVQSPDRELRCIQCRTHEECETEGRTRARSFRMRNSQRLGWMVKVIETGRKSFEGGWGPRVREGLKLHRRQSRFRGLSSVCKS